MQKFYAYIFALYFASLGISPLWGAHFHHTNNHSSLDSHETQHLKKQHSKSHHQKSRNNDLNNQDHCAVHCQIESLLEHALENQTLYNVIKVDSPLKIQDKKQVSALTQQTPRIYRNTFIYFATTIPPPLQKKWQTLCSAARAPPIH